MPEYVLDLATHLRELGYRAFLDRENLDMDADAYFSIPTFITSLQECTYYILLLTELCADLMTARKGKTSWIHDEYQHAIRVVNSGRLSIIPVLLEPNGPTDLFTRDIMVDLTPNWRDRKLDRLFPAHQSRCQNRSEELSRTVGEFDPIFLRALVGQRSCCAQPTWKLPSIISSACSTQSTADQVASSYLPAPVCEPRNDLCSHLLGLLQAAWNPESNVIEIIVMIYGGVPYKRRGSLLIGRPLRAR
jgi:hypothetical protein